MLFDYSFRLYLNYLTLTNYNLNPLLFLGSSTDCRKPCRSFSHCSLNHSPIGCLFTVSTNLFSINRTFLNLESVILDFKSSPMLFGIDCSIASDSFLFRQKAVYHIFGKSDGIT